MDCTPSQVVEYFFEQEETEGSPNKKRKCKGCKNYYSGNTHGYSNLLGHVSSKHSDYKVIMKTKLSPETNSFKKSTDLYE